MAKCKLGAAVNNAKALYNLAMALMDTWLAFDFATAHKLLLQATALPPKLQKVPMLKDVARLGVDAAQYTLGLNYQHGIYVRQDFGQAKVWYERAMLSNGPSCGLAANNLGLMYLQGNQGLNRNLSKAEECVLLAYRCAEYKAAPNLANLYILLRQPSKVKRWYNAARSHKMTSRELDNACQKFLAKFGNAMENGSCLLTIMRPLFEAMHDTMSSPVDQSPAHFDRKVLEEHAAKGGGYAKRLLQSQIAYEHAIHIFLSAREQGYFDVHAFIDQLHLSCKLEMSGIVCKLPAHLAEGLVTVLDDAISGQKCTHSEMDMKVQLILAYLTALKSLPASTAILSASVDKYPFCAEFLALWGCNYCFQTDYESALRDFKKAMEISPDSYDLWYDIAVTSNLHEDSLDDAHLGWLKQKQVPLLYQNFVNQAPKDHRKLPAALYGIASSFACEIMKKWHSSTKERRVIAQQVEEFKRKGQEAEKNQLPHFLPYSEGLGRSTLGLYGLMLGLDDLAEDNTNESGRSQKLSQLLGEKETSSPDELLASATQKMAQLLRPTSSQNDGADTPVLGVHRTKIILQQRKVLAESARSTSVCTWTTPAPQDKHICSIVGLKGIALGDLDVSRDYVATGCVLTVTVIEPPVLMVGVSFIVVDHNKDAERLVIYNLPGNFPSNCDKYSVGTETAIIEPYVRQCANGSSAIRVDEPSTIIVTGKRRDKPCNYCRKKDASKSCGKCRKVVHCNQTCQVRDWKLLGHKDACGIQPQKLKQIKVGIDEAHTAATEDSQGKVDVPSVEVVMQRKGQKPAEGKHTSNEKEECNGKDIVDAPSDGTTTTTTTQREAQSHVDLNSKDAVAMPRKQAIVTAKARSTTEHDSSSNDDAMTFVEL